jgi:mannose-6-phosphate isomerase
MYPLKFDPIYQYRMWGGRRLADLLSARLPDGPVGESWVLSDRDDHASLVSDGALKGRTIAQLMTAFPEEFMGRLAGRFPRFPLLLKFLDAREMLSVQVHPDGENGKTEAWVVLEAGVESRIFAGLVEGASENDLRDAMDDGEIASRLSSFHPAAGDAVFLPAGTVHCLGGDLVVFEVQQNSDTTYRLYDWGRIDRRTRERRPLQVDSALAAVNFAENEGGLVRPVLEDAAPPDREKLFDCDYFLVSRLSADSPFPVGAADVPSIVVCIEGGGRIEAGGVEYAVAKGDVFLLPAGLGVCTCLPELSAITVLEIAIPE